MYCARVRLCIVCTYNTVHMFTTDRVQYIEKPRIAFFDMYCMYNTYIEIIAQVGELVTSLCENFRNFPPSLGN